MKKVLTKLLILLLIFVSATLVFTRMMNREVTENAVDMEKASLPVMYMKVSDTIVNRMFGYISEMDGSTIRDTVTPLPMDRNLTLAVDAKGKTIRNVTYTVENIDGSEIIENSVIKSFSQDGNYMTADFHLEMPIRMNQEYTLRMELDYGEEDSAYYYTRIVQRSTVEVGDYLNFVQMFYETSLNKEQADSLAAYIEPNQSGNQKSYYQVDIHSSLDRITWGSLAPALVQRAVPQIREVNETTVSISLQYMIRASREDGDAEYYSVTEFYRMRKSSDRVVLLDFERSAEQIFDAELPVLTNSGISLGVTGKDVEYATNMTADIAAFVVNGDLWSYNRGVNKCTRIFSFRGEDSDSCDDREEHPEHDMNIVRVEESGDVVFVVYGYMNRGSHEGEMGAAVYYFSAERNVVEEVLFVPSKSSFAVLDRNLSRLSYVSTNEQMYFYLNESLYQIDLKTGGYEILVEEIPDDCFVVSEGQTSAAWMEAEDIGHRVYVRNFDDGATQEITADAGQQIRALGFINEDFICGYANDSDIIRDITGNETFAMHTIRIIGQDGTVRKEYRQDGYYVTGISVSEGLLEMERVIREGDGFAETTADHIMNGEQQSAEMVTGRLAVMEERKGQEFVLEFSSKGKTSSLLKLLPKYVYSEVTADLSLDYAQAQGERYYVYGKGRLLDICASPAEAIMLADENVGVVLNEAQAYVWERGNRTEAAEVDPSGEPSAFQNASLNESELSESLGDNGTLLNLTGCTLDQVLYLLSTGRSVVVKTGASESLLMVGYDRYGNTWLYHASTGETTALGPNDSKALFEANGNVFISYQMKE